MSATARVAHLATRDEVIAFLLVSRKTFDRQVSPHLARVAIGRHRPRRPAALGLRAHDDPEGDAPQSARRDDREAQ